MGVSYTFRCVGKRSMNNKIEILSRSVFLTLRKVSRSAGVAFVIEQKERE